MFSVVINGQRHEFAEGMTILTACRKLGLEIPNLCHDDRLTPAGACRLCVVEVNGWDREAPACSTLLQPGMIIETHSPAVEATRRTLLELLAAEYSSEAVIRWPEKPFHRWLREYGEVARGSRLRAEESTIQQPFGNESVGDSLEATAAVFRDATHPYLHADMAQCITCFRCVRMCDEVQGQFVWRVWNRGAATRLRPGSAPTLLASNCVSCGACVDTCPTGALEDQSVLALGLPTQWTRTTCPYCGVGCEMNVGTRGARIVQVKPVLEAPVNRGHLCVKGRYAFDFVRAPDRITEPMIRVQGVWKTVSWSEAIGHVATQLRRLIQEFGPDSVGVLGSARGTNEENYLAQKFARLGLGTNNVDCCARVCHAPTAAAMKAMLGTGAATNSFEDIEHAGAFLLCGTNATENHPIVGARVKQAVLRGAKLIVVDPREIELAQYADVHLALRPGTNVPLLNALAWVIVEEALFDETAVRERVSDWEEFQAFIRPYSPEKVAEQCGVPAELIRAAARLYATTRPAMCFHGLGMTEHTQGTEGVMCLVNLALLTGNWGKPGSGVNPLRGQNNVQGAAHMGCEPGNLTGFVGVEEGRARFEDLWRARLPTQPGLNLMQMIDSAGRGSLKALWAIGYDVVLTNPDAHATTRSLQTLELVVVQDLFLNEVARQCGSVFLPAAASFEKDGTFMNSERRVQRIRQVIEPPGQARPDWEIICEVARALGKGEFFNFHSVQQIWEEIRTVWPAGHGITYERLEQGGLQWPCPTVEHPGTVRLHTESFAGGLRAPLKRIPFRPSEETISAEFPWILTTGRTLYQFNAGTMTMRTPNAGLRPTDVLEVAVEDAERLQLRDGERVRVHSRHGSTELPVHLDRAVKAGELFATFHTPRADLNRLTGPVGDSVVQTPEYKVVAVRIEKIEIDGTSAATER